MGGPVASDLNYQNRAKYQSRCSPIKDAESFVVKL